MMDLIEVEVHNDNLAFEDNSRCPEVLTQQ